MVRCSLCLTPCADSDAIVADGQTFHKDCFKCLRCQTQLTLDHYKLISLGPVCPDGTCSAQKSSSSQKPSSSSTSTPTTAKPRNRVPVWTEEFDEEGDPYYFNHVTGESLWEKPDDFETAEMIESDEDSDYLSEDDEYKETSNGAASASPRKSDADRQRAREELLQQEREAAEQAARIKRQAIERDSKRREAERMAREREEAARREEEDRRRLEQEEDAEKRRRREMAAQKNRKAQDEQNRRQSEAARQREREEARLKKEQQKKRDQAQKEEQKRREAAREDRDKKRANLEKLFSAEVNKKKSLQDSISKQGIASSWEIEKQRQQEFKRKLGKGTAGGGNNGSSGSLDIAKVKTRRKAPSSPPQPKPAVSMTMAGVGASGGGGDGASDDLAALFQRLGIGDAHLKLFIQEEMKVGDVLLLSPKELEEMLPTKGPRVRLSKFIADQRLKDELAFLIRGEYFKKIVTFGTSRRRLIFLNESLTSLVWAENPNRIKGALERLTSIIPGDPTSKSGSLQFTATGTIQGKKRSLLLQADSVDTQQKWVNGLQKALELNAHR